jgi:glucose-1-phosphate adenylyltransferase
MGVYVFTRDKLIEIVKKSYETGGDTINDDIISANLDTLNVIAYEHKGYAAIMDCPKAYRRANFELLDAEVRKDLFNAQRPIYTKTRDDMPTRYGTQSSVTNSLVAEGCVIEGTVKNSVLFRGVKIEKGAVVENSILMQSVTVGENAVIDQVVSDKNAVISAGMTVKGTEEKAFFVEKNQTL